MPNDRSSGEILGKFDGLHDDTNVIKTWIVNEMNSSVNLNPNII